MNKDTVSIWLRTEAEKLGTRIEKLENKINKLIAMKSFIHNLDKVEEINLEIKLLRATQSKLYEMIGRASDELEVKDTSNILELVYSNPILLNLYNIDSIFRACIEYALSSKLSKEEALIFCITESYKTTRKVEDALMAHMYGDK